MLDSIQLFNKKTKLNIVINSQHYKIQQFPLKLPTLPAFCLF